MKFLKLSIITFSLLLSANIQAGYYAPDPVEITVYEDGAGEARGSAASARFSDNDVEEIGCRVLGIAGAFTQVQCQATDSLGTMFSCASTDANIVAAAQAASIYSWFLIEWNADKQCTFLLVSTKSFHIPTKNNKKE